MTTMAVIAHFHPNNHFDDNFLTMVDCLSSVVDNVVVVTTSVIEPTALLAYGNVELICRPNVGYDFFSYRVGYSLVHTRPSVERVIFTNSSILVINSERFRQFLSSVKSMAPLRAIYGICCSEQIVRHLQSYFLVIGREVLEERWFADFFNNVWPQRNKLDLIIKYELGLSQEAARAGVPLVPLFEPSPEQLGRGREAWREWLLANEGVERLRTLSKTELDAFNPSQFLASEIADMAGVVKAEVMRDNPHGIDLSFIEASGDARAVTSAHLVVDQLRTFYRRSEDNLASLAVDIQPLPWHRSVALKNFETSQPRVAIVVHLFHGSMLPEFSAIARRIIEPFDVFITTPFEDLIVPCLNAFDLARCVCVRLSENRGRDIGPFMSLLRSGALNDYTAVLKVHSKKSDYSPLGDAWRQQLLHAVAGTTYTVRGSVRLIEKGAGIVGPHFNYLTNETYWGANRERVDAILKHMHVATPAGGVQLGFFGGSMFWFSPKALLPLQSLDEQHIAFELERGLQDGTMAHALERIFCPLARSLGFRTTSIHADGSEIDDMRGLDNRVLVL